MIYIALPSYDGTRRNASTFVEFTKHTRHDVVLMENSCSLLARCFNDCWVAALNARAKGNVTHFLMMHADIIPQAPFLDILVDEMTRVGADVLSVVSPIKCSEGVTSTSIEMQDKWHPRRLTMTEIFQRQETWTEEGLLVNTGLMLIDFTKPWVEEICFTINDEIRKKEDGTFEALVEPEDWHFSRQARGLGAKIFATRKIKLNHIGIGVFGNHGIWGTCTTDPVYRK